MTDRNTLKRAAEAATPGSWKSFYKHKYDEWHVALDCDSPGMNIGLFADGCPTGQADAQFIALANPATILSLLADLEAKEEEIGRLEKGRKIQANAAKTLAHSIRAEVTHLEEKDRSEYFAAKSLDSERDMNAHLTHENESLRAQLTALREENKSLKSLLVPFADEAGEWDDTDEKLADSYMPLIGHEQDSKMAKATFCLGDLRRARAATEADND